MVRPTHEGRSRPLTDAESDSGSGTTVGDDGIDFDTGGSDPGGGGGAVTPPFTELLAVVTDSADAEQWPTGTIGELDFNVANWWDITLTDDLTLTIANAPASGTIGLLHLIIRQGGTGSYVLTYPAEVEWPDTDGTEGGSAPVLFTVVDSRDFVELITEDGGTSYGGSHGSGGGSSANAELNIEGGQSVIKPHGSMGSTETFDPTDGNVHTGTLDANLTVTLNPPSGSGACYLVFVFTEDGTGGRTVTWPGSVTEAGTHDLTADTFQECEVRSYDGGTSWIATWIGSASAVGALDDLTDVTITTPAEDDTLRYRSGVWVNDNRRWEPVTTNPGGGPEIVWDGDDIVMTWRAY